MKLHWEGWTAGFGWALTSLILHTVLCLLMLTVLVIYIHSFCYKTTKTTNYSRALLASVLVGLIHVFGNYCVSNVFILVFDIRFDNHCFYRILCSTFPIYTQRGILYTFLVYRLKTVFHKTIFALNEVSIYILLVIIIAVPIPLASLQVYFSYIHHDFRCSNSRELFIINIIAGLSDIITYLSLSYLFIYKLKQLMTLDHTKNADKSRKLRRVANKLTILTNVATVSSLLTLICVSMAFFPYPMSSLDMIVNNTCMLLTFNSLDKYYGKLCCCCVHLQRQCFRISIIHHELYISQSKNTISTKTGMNDPSSAISPPLPVTQLSIQKN